MVPPILGILFEINIVKFLPNIVDVKKEEHVDEVTFFETTFLNSEYSIREDVHKIFKRYCTQRFWLKYIFSL